MDELYQEYPVVAPIVGPVVNFLRFLNAPLLRWLQPANPTPQRQQFKHIPAPTNPISDGSVVSCTFGYSGGSIINDDGIKLVIPKGAVSRTDSVTFYLAVGFCAPFNLESVKGNLVSPYYWIGVSKSYQFQKPICIEFEHFAVVTNPRSSDYCLLSCEDDDESHTMRPIKYDLSFEVLGDTSLCTFETFHFCSYCLYCKRKQPNQNVNRIGAFYLKPKNFEFLDHFAVEVWFSFPISYCIRRNKELYKKKGMKLDCSHTFEASCSVDKSNASCFMLSYEHSIKGWRVDHSRSTEILTRDMNNYFDYTDVEELLTYEENSLFPPRFIINVAKKRKCNVDLDTYITVTLQSKAKRKASRDYASFKLLVSPMSTKSSTNSKVNFYQLMRYLRTLNDNAVTDFDISCFVTYLLPRNGETVIEDMKKRHISKEDKIKKICKAFLREGASWSTLYKALKKAEFTTLAKKVKSRYLESM